jgi:hypothetical protein
MPKKKVAAEAAELEETPVEPANEVSETKAPKAEVKTEAHVVVSGQVVRTYTLEIHGEQFSELAAKYAGKIGGSVK